MTDEPLRSLLLLVDDTPANLRLLTEAFAHEYELMIARSGEEALDILKEGPLPDTILLDIMMPGMDGYEVCRRIKADPRTRDVPVIFITAATSEQAEEQGLRIGAVDYVTKPFSVPVVRARVRTQIELRRRTQMLERLASVDALTGVANRRRFDEVLEWEWSRAQRAHETIALLFIDIDHFKAYNDAYGHGVGDEVLRHVARCARQAVRRPSDLVARFAGDEFVVLLPATQAEGARRIAEELAVLIESRQAPLKVEGVELQVTASIGWSSMTAAPGRSAKALIESADAALYEAKRLGRNRVHGATG